MATSGIVNAHAVNIQDGNERQNRPKKLYFGVFFDGTSNNMVQKKDAKSYRKKQQEVKSEYRNGRNDDEWELSVIDNNGDSFDNGANQIPTQNNGMPEEGYSNIAILHSYYRGMSEEELNVMKKKYDIWIFNVYVEGAGTDAIYDGGMIDKAYNWKGSVMGKGHSGVSKLVAKAVAIVRERIKVVKVSDYPQTEVHFDVYGFSRGATCARLFSYLTQREDTSHPLGCEPEFEDSLACSYYKNNFLHFFDDLKFKRITVDFLGIYDTVSSIGGISVDSYNNNVSDYGLDSPMLVNVLNTFHLCAMDEFREHFQLTDIGSACNKGNNAEIFMPGCHSDVGGGYKTKEKNHFELTKENRYLPFNNIDKENMITKPVNKETLTKMGWCEKKECKTNVNTVEVWRKVQCGYSNIPLEMMKTRVESVLDRHSFNDTSTKYPISSIFSEWSNVLINKSKSAKGRCWYYPGGSFSSESYIKLRKYLHFSSTNAIGFTPDYYGNVICRHVYHGDSQCSERIPICKAF